MTKDIELKQTATQPLGKYLVESGIITSAQLEIALYEQQKTDKRIGEILSEQGWVKQETIEYFVKKVILPERETSRNKERFLDRDLSQPSVQFATALKIDLSPQKTTRFLLVLAFGIIFACVLIQVGTYVSPGYLLQETLVSLFDINEELTVPAFFSWSLLLFCAFLLVVIAYSKKIAGDRYALYWTALAVIFFYISVDEAISIHERIGMVITHKLNPSGLFYYAWTIPGSIFVAIFLVAFLRFINHLPTRTKYLFLLAGGIYIGGGLFVEMYNGYLESLYGNSPIYYAFTTLEESMEMLGIIIFIYGLMSYISYMKGIDLLVSISARKVKSQREKVVESDS